MHTRFPGTRARTFLNAMAALCLAIIGSPLSAATSTSNDEAMALCKTEMMSGHSATDVDDLRVRRHDDVPFVYGTANFADIKSIHFRCKVFEEMVREVMYLVKDPEYVDGRAWSKDRPHGEAPSDLVLDDAAMSPPPLDHPSPHFVRVPD